MNTKLGFSQAAELLSGQSSTVWTIHDRACAKLSAGEDIQLLSVGDPDLDTLDSTIEHAINSLKKGRTHYSPGAGELDLRKTIADIETRTAQRPCSANEVLIFPGATNAIYTVMACLLNTGDEVVIPEPMYIGYHGIFDIIGAKVVNVAMQADNLFRLDIEQVKNAITDKTRVLFLNTPGNPAGNIIPAETLTELAAYCLERNIWLVCDEVYSMITFEEPHVSLRRVAASLDNIIIIDGLSKSHAMTGWRLGWSVAAESVTERLLGFTSSIIFGCCQFIQDTARYALMNDEQYMTDIRREYKKRRDYVCDRIAAIPGLRYQPPKAGMFIMIDVTEIAKDGYAFAELLLQNQGVSVLPGEGFGATTKGFVRLSLTLPVSELTTALDRVEKFVLAQSAVGNHSTRLT